ncbi:phage N-6-adenine-methyltransferase [Agromyces atrinae]|uniref:phage N-6-adenine-methyltransferase n=1 Tax=Agromyces atrinae TaxID=592376 RepID=UPI001F564B52|nr:phage N-6-adenine-methyltransferase [Agromyces atrinae]MCI2958209.1 phage N-6-adenine-methyltransferase [Agromyces atrinae]
MSGPGRSLIVGRTSAASDSGDGDMFAKRNDRWLTPLPLIHALGEFDLDPCGAPGHPTAKEVWTPEEFGDGLSMPWSGRVWLNPPYGRTMEDWMRALAEHGHGTALIFARTETKLFHELVWPLASGILFLRGRVTFLDLDGDPASASSGAPSCLISYGGDDATLLASSGITGQFVPLQA